MSDTFKQELKVFNNRKLEDLYYNSVFNYNNKSITGGKNKKKDLIDKHDTNQDPDPDNENNEEYIHEINFENNSDKPIKEFRKNKEFLNRDDFIKFNIIGEEKNKETSNNFWFF